MWSLALDADEREGGAQPFHFFSDAHPKGYACRSAGLAERIAGELAAVSAQVVAVVFHRSTGAAMPATGLSAATCDIEVSLCEAVAHFGDVDDVATMHAEGLRHMGGDVYSSVAVEGDVAAASDADDFPCLHVHLLHLKVMVVMYW